MKRKWSKMASYCLAIGLGLISVSYFVFEASADSANSQWTEVAFDGLTFFGVLAIGGLSALGISVVLFAMAVSAKQ